MSSSGMVCAASGKSAGRRSCLAMAAAGVEARETVQDKAPLFREFVAGP